MRDWSMCHGGFFGVIFLGADVPILGSGVLNLEPLWCFLPPRVLASFLEISLARFFRRVLLRSSRFIELWWPRYRSEA